MFRKKLQRIFSIILAAGISVSLLSACEKSESVPEETTSLETATFETTSLDTTVDTTTAVTTTVTEPTTTETTVETTTATSVTTAETTVKTTRELTAEEIEIMNEMPEIVFILSHYYTGSNISGYYITKSGEVKIFDFRNSGEQICNVIEVIDELKNATCSETVINNEWIKAEDLKAVPEYKMVEYYKTLLQINKDSKVIRYNNYADAEFGYGEFYGLRIIDSNTEIITLDGWGETYYINTDDISGELVFTEIFPSLPYIY